MFRWGKKKKQMVQPLELEDWQEKIEQTLQNESYFSEVQEPEHLKLYIYWEGYRPLHDPLEVFQGWRLLVQKMDSEGQVEPYRDHWEEQYERIVAYLHMYVSKSTVWYCDDDGSEIDLFNNRRLNQKRAQWINSLWDDWELRDEK